MTSLSLRAGLLSGLILLLLLGVWHIATLQPAANSAPAPTLTPEQIEYLKLQGKDPTVSSADKKTSGFPTLAQMGQTMVHHLSQPFYDNGPNDKGIGLQLAYSLARVALGFGIACLVAIPLGFLLGMSPLVYKSLYPYINVLKPISPLAWMPLALYTIKDSNISGVFVIFICSVWPM
ncbi:MAG: nitrate ABC transporter, permease protein, partial [Burkholderiaceae bacterium]|nr:nitrate ABC transporter, permease protein [Burkholderiaceae bacterium]